MEVTPRIRGIMFSADSNEAAIALPRCCQIDWLTEKSASVRHVKRSLARAVKLRVSVHQLSASGANHC